MATYSLVATSANQPKVDVTGTVTRIQNSGTGLSLSLSAGDVIHFTNIRIPHGSTIYKIEVLGRVQNGGGVHIFQSGAQGSAASGLSAVMFGSATLASAYERKDVVVTGVLPYKVSVSDDAANRFITPSLTVDAVTSGTISQTITMIVQYVYNP